MRRRCRAWVAERIVGALHDGLRVEIKDFDNSLRVLLIILLRDGRSCEKSLPLSRQANKDSGMRIIAYMNSMCEVGWIANTTHAGTSLVNGIDPRINLIVSFYLAYSYACWAIAWWR